MPNSDSTIYRVTLGSGKYAESRDLSGAQLQQVVPQFQQRGTKYSIQKINQVNSPDGINADLTYSVSGERDGQRYTENIKGLDLLNGGYEKLNSSFKNLSVLQDGGTFKSYEHMQAAEQLPELRRNYQNAIASGDKDLEKVYGKQLAGNIAFQYEREDYGNALADARDRMKAKGNEQASRFYDEALEIMEAPDKYQGNFLTAVKNFFKGAKDDADDRDFYSFGVTEAARNLNAAGILRKVEDAFGTINDIDEEKLKGVLSDKEIDTLTAFMALASANAERASDLSRGYKNGITATEAVPFMVEFALAGVTGGASLGGAAVNLGTKVGIKVGTKAGAEALSKIILKKMGKEIADDAVRGATKAMTRGLSKEGATKLANGITTAAVNMTHPLMLPTYLRSVSDQLTAIDDEGHLMSVGKALGRGMLDGAIEIASEMSGGVLNLPGKAIGKLTAGTAFGKIADAIMDFGAAKWLERSGFHGLVGEIGEEWIGNAARVLTGLMDKDEFKAFASLENQLDMVASFAPMTLLGVGTESINNARWRNAYAEPMSKMLARICGGVPQKYIDHFQGAFKSPEDIGRAVAGYLETAIENGVKLSPEDINLALNFTRSASLEKLAEALGEKKKEFDRQSNRNIMAQNWGVSAEDPSAQFWYTRDGEMASQYGDEGVRVVTDDKGNSFYFLGQIGSQVLLRDARTGEVTFQTNDQYNDGLASNKYTEEEFASPDAYLDLVQQKVDEKKEATRMDEEYQKQKASVMEKAFTGEAFQHGTDNVRVVGGLSDTTNATIQYEDGRTEQVSWETVARDMGTPIYTESDAKRDERRARESESMNIEARRINRGAEDAVASGDPVQFEKDGNQYGLTRVDVVTGEDGESRYQVTAVDAQGNGVRFDDMTPEQVSALVSEEQAPKTDTQGAVEEQAQTDQEEEAISRNTSMDGSVDEMALIKDNPRAWARYHDSTLGEQDTNTFLQDLVLSMKRDLARKQNDAAHEMDLNKRAKMFKELQEQDIPAVQELQSLLDERLQAEADRQKEAQEADAEMARIEAEAKAEAERQAAEEKSRKEAEKADTETKEGEDTVGGSPVAASYLFSGVGVIKSPAYLLHAIAGAFQRSANKIEDIRSKLFDKFQEYANMEEFLNDTDVVESIKAELRKAIEQEYGADGVALFDEIMNYPTGMPAKYGDRMESSIEMLEAKLSAAEAEAKAEAERKAAEEAKAKEEAAKEAARIQAEKEAEAKAKAEEEESKKNETAKPVESKKSEDEIRITKNTPDEDIIFMRRTSQGEVDIMKRKAWTKRVVDIRTAEDGFGEANGLWYVKKSIAGRTHDCLVVWFRNKPSSSVVSIAESAMNLTYAEDTIKAIADTIRAEATAEAAKPGESKQAEKKPKRTAKEQKMDQHFQDNHDRNFQTAVEIQGEMQGKPKSSPFKMHETAGKDELRPVMSGVYHSDGYAVSTDAHVLVASKQDYDAKNEGKVVDKDGNEIPQGPANKFPDWKRVIPQNTRKVDFDPADMLSFISAMRTRMNEMVKQFKARGENPESAQKMFSRAHVIVRFADGTEVAYKAPLLEKACRAAVHIGATDIELNKGNEKRFASIMKSDNGVVLMMPYLSQGFPMEATPDNQWDNPWAYDVKQRMPSEADNAESFVTGKPAGEIRRSRVAENPVSEATKKRIEERIQAWEKKVKNLPGKIHIVRKVEDLPESLRGLVKVSRDEGGRDRGFYLPGTDEAYILVDNLRYASEVDDVMMHELVSHKGIRGLFSDSKDFDALCDSVWDMMDATSRGWGIDYALMSRGLALTAENRQKAAQDEAIRREAADEYIAHLSEGMSIKRNDRILDRVIDAIKKALRAAGIDIKLTNRELRNIIRKSYERLLEDETNPEALRSADETAFQGDGKALRSTVREPELRQRSQEYYDRFYVEKARSKQAPLDRSNMTQEKLDAGNAMIDVIREMMMPYTDAEATNGKGKRYLPAEVYGLSTIFDNSSYGKTVENTLICDRTLAYNDFVDEVKRQLGRPITARESFLASQMLMDIAVDPQCMYCYVSLDRKAYDEFLKRYAEARTDVLKKYAALEDKSKENTDKLYSEFLAGRKDTPNMRSRFDAWLQHADEAGLDTPEKIDAAETEMLQGLTTAEARQQVKVDQVTEEWRKVSEKLDGMTKKAQKEYKQSEEYRNAYRNYMASPAGQVVDAEAYAQSASWAKKPADFRSYFGELLKATKQGLSGIMAQYGLRFYSFSEYTPAFILENMQQVRDAALRGLKGFAYTKKTDFARIFAPAGMNINISCFGRRNSEGDVVMDDKQGANWDEVRSLREQFPGVGSVFVATDDSMVEWALNQDWIDVIIPFHIVRTGADIADFYKWTNYKDMQADTTAEGKAKDIYPWEHKNNRETFLQLAQERGLSPRFADVKLANGESITTHPNYMRLVNETRRPAEETPLLTPVFDVEAAKTSFAQFIEKGGYYDGYYVAEGAFEDGVAQVVEDIKAGRSADQVDYGRQDMPIDMADKLSSYRKKYNNHQNVPLTRNLTSGMKSDILFGEAGIRRSSLYTEEMEDIRQKAIADGTILKAPDGKTPSKLNERQWLQVRTKAFLDWFGDWLNDPENASKVVDENGEPMVVYHGTSWEPMEEKDGNAVFKSGWFTSIKNRATGYGEPVAAFINMRNPAYSGNLNTTEGFDLNNPKTFGEYDGYLNLENYPSIPVISEFGKRRIKMKNPSNYEEVIAERLANMPTGKQFFSIIPVSSNQIKSATDNNGEFSSNNPDIRFSVTLSDKVLSAFNDAINGKTGNPIRIAKLSKEGRDYLEALSDLPFKNDVYLALNYDDLRHIYNNHYAENEKDKGNNIPLSENDIRRMIDVFAFPTKIYFFYDEKQDHRPSFIFLMESSDGEYNLMEVSRTKKGLLVPKSFYKNKKSHQQRVMELDSLLSTPEAYSAVSSSDTKIPILLESPKVNLNFSRVTPEQDAEYMAAVEAGDIEKAQQMVDEVSEQWARLSDVRDKDGKLQKRYHASRSKTKFTIFETGLSRNRENIGSHFGTKYAGDLLTDFGDGTAPRYEVYLNIENPYETMDMYAGDVLEMATEAKVIAQIFDDEKSIRRLTEYYPELEHINNREDYYAYRYGEDNSPIETAWDEKFNNGLEVAEIFRGLLVKAGYDGIKYENLGEYAFGEDNTSWIAFYSEQIKSAEPVTYDNDGNIIPLSERFNPDKKDIRYSHVTPEMDQAYEDAYNDGDDEAADELVRQAAEMYGYTTFGSHDTNATIFVNVETGENWDDLSWEEKEKWNDRDDWDEYWEERDFYAFNDGRARSNIEIPAIFFHPQVDEYHEYGKRTINAYLKIENPIINPEIPDRGQDNAGRKAMESWMAQGYDAMIREYDGEIDEIAVFKPEQIKSADTYTFDDDGYLVPLSERFNSYTPDIRFSRAYHGSPVSFDMFSNEYAGNGEGAQAHGYGIYVTMDENIARDRYATRLSKGIKGKIALSNLLDPLDNEIDMIQWKAIDLIEKDLYTIRFKGAINGGYVNEEYKKGGEEGLYEYLKAGLPDSPEAGVRFITKQFADRLDKMKAEQKPLQERYDSIKADADYRHLYTVDIPEDTGSNYLVEEEAADPEIIKKAVDAAFENPAIEGKIKGVYDSVEDYKEDVLKNLEGANNRKLYRTVANVVDAQPGSEDNKAASEIFRRLGFVGIKYNGKIDGECAVIFNDSDVKIEDHARFSRVTPEQDAEYRKAYESGDEAKAQEILDSVAMKAGFRTIAYHGTPDGGFNVFDNSHRYGEMYFTDNNYVANSYKNDYRGDNPMIYRVYLKLSNMVKFDARNRSYNDLADDYKIEDLIRRAKDQGKRGVVITNIYDAPSGWSKDPDNIGTDFLMLNQSDIKSAEPFTFDDKGKLIPLSERFNTETPDIRYSFAKDVEEFDSNYEKAVESKGVVMPGLSSMQFDVVNVPKHDFNGTGSQAISKAKKWAAENLVGYHVAHAGTENEFKYYISDDLREGPIGKYLSASATTLSDNLGIHLAVLKKLIDVIESSREVEFHADYEKEDGKRGDAISHNKVIVHRLYTAVKSEYDGKVYKVKTTVKEYRNSNNEPYTYQVTEIESPISGSQPSNALGDSTVISGAILLNNVRKSKQKNVNLLNSRENVLRSNITPEQDSEYLDAVKAGDMEKAQRMVDETVRSAGAILDKDNNPVYLYHGTPRFGFTIFNDDRDRGVIYTTTQRTVAANYGGQGYAAVRELRKGIKGGDSIGTIISNWESFTGQKVRIATAEERERSIADCEAKSIEVVNRLEELYKDYNGDLPNDESGEAGNATAWMANLFYDAANHVDMFEAGNDTYDIISKDVTRYQESKDYLRKYRDDNYEALSSEEQRGNKAFIDYLLHWNSGDVAIDIQYGYMNAVYPDDVLVDEMGSLALPDTIKDSIDKAKNVGAYQLYGFADNILEVDCNEKQWYYIDFNGVQTSTDDIARWAKEHGYDAVHFANVYDYGDIADDYVFFNSNQVKSADPVTYDDKGEVVPLSNRFNENTPDIRFSTNDAYEIKKRAEEDGTFMLAPNGKKSKLNEKQWAMVRTKNFKDWFGDWINDPENSSKVVDPETGEPRVVYHGTTWDPMKEKPGKAVFDDNRVGDNFGFVDIDWNFFFTASEKAAEGYGKGIPVFLNIRNMNNHVIKTEVCYEMTEDIAHGIVVEAHDFGSEDDVTTEVDNATGTHYTIRAVNMDEASEKFRKDLEAWDDEHKQEVEDRMDAITEEVKSLEDKIKNEVDRSIFEKTGMEAMYGADYDTVAERSYYSLSSILHDLLNLSSERFSADLSEEKSKLVEYEKRISDLWKEHARLMYREGIEGYPVFDESLSYEYDYHQSDLYALDDPANIKSAISNNGEFSKSNPDIRFSRFADEEDVVRYSKVTDQEEIDRLNSEPTVKVYRAMQLIDGKLYPPMSAKEPVEKVSKKGNRYTRWEFKSPIELGAWEKADERPDLVDEEGNFTLNKGNGDSIKARYNPYIHTSTTPLNDQFSSAQSRPELVTVEVEVPESELTSGYHAEKAKDSVGKLEWHAGPIQGQLTGTREVILSRWDKPVRIVPESEVADSIMEMLDGKSFEWQSNVVTPKLRAELEQRGVRFYETDNQGNRIEEEATDIRRSVTYDESVMNLDEIFAATASEGLESVMGDGYDRTMMRSFSNALEEQKDDIITRAMRGDLSIANAVEAMVGDMALAETLSADGKRLVSDVREGMQDTFLAEVPTAAAMWLCYTSSHRNNRGDFFDEAERYVVADKLGMTDKARAEDDALASSVRYSRVIDANADSVAGMYEYGTAFWRNRLKEGYVNQYDSIDWLIGAIEKVTGKVAKAFEDVRLALNQMSSKGAQAMEDYIRGYMKPMWQAVYDIVKANPTGIERSGSRLGREKRFRKAGLEAVSRYVMLKHGLERNEYMAQDRGEARDYAGLTALTGTEDLAEMTRLAQQEVEAFEAAAGSQLIDNLWKRINSATKRTLEQQRNYGLISDEVYNKVRRMYKYYVPLRGFNETTAEDLYEYYTSSTGGFSAPMQVAKGRISESENPFGFIGSMASSGIAQGVKNQAKQTLYAFLANRPDNGVATISDCWYEIGTAPDGSMMYTQVYPAFRAGLDTEAARQEYENWEQNMKGKAEAGLAVKGLSKVDLKGSVVHISNSSAPEHVIKLKVNGEDKMITLNGNPRAAQAVNGLLNVEKSKDYQVWFGKMLRFLANVNTSFNPVFWYSNLQRDLLFSLMAVNVKEDGAYGKAFRSNWLKAWKVVPMLFKQKNGTLGDSYLEQMYREFSENGGITGYTVVVDNEQWESELEHFMRDTETAPVARRFKGALEKIYSFGESIEQVNRFAAFLTSREQGKSVQEAVNDAKELTVNFNTKGSGKAISMTEASKLVDKDGKPLNKTQQLMVVAAGILPVYARRCILFFNAAVQGLSAMYKLWQKNRKGFSKWATGYFAMGVAMALIHAMIDDDDDYLDMPDYERRNNVMLGLKGVYVKWAMPQECRVFYGIGDMFVNHIMGREPDRDNFKGLSGEFLSLIGDVLPINATDGIRGIAPQQLMPIIELYMNKNFMGANIYRDNRYMSDEEKKRNPKFQQAYSSTWQPLVDVSRWLNDITGGDDTTAGIVNINPAAVEHIVTGYGGGLFTTISDMAKLATLPFGQEFSVRNTPLLSRMLTINDERYRNSHVTNLYNYYKAEAEHAKTRANKYKAAGDTESLSALRQSDSWRYRKVFEANKNSIKRYDEMMKNATDERERKQIAKLQDQLRIKMISEMEG